MYRLNRIIKIKKYLNIYKTKRINSVMKVQNLVESKKDMSDMSPEQIKEMQKGQCIFCQIASGKVQSKKIYEDEKVVAILDINPSNPGHVLILPKEHYSIMPQINETEISHIFMVAKAISHMMLRSLKAGGTNIFVANGVAAGQKAQHFMVHVIPRKESDSLDFTIPENRFPKEELLKLETVLRKKLGTFEGKNEDGEEKAEEEVEEEAEEEEKPAKKQNNVFDAKFVDKKEKKIKELRHDDIHEIREEKSAGVDLDEIAKMLGDIRKM